ncbi:MAG: ComF family protein [Gammaproteobacteria bacterium]|nr:ComF family protein [Gammaproteobacteria bacterium]
MNKWLRIAHEWLLPRHCLLCLGPAQSINLCKGCRAALPRLENPCEGCATPLVIGQRCARCLKRPPPFYQVRIPYLYADPLAGLIQALKYRHRLAAAAVLGSLLAEYLETHGFAAPQCIVPVPLHPERQRQRGFNQSLEIARALSARLAVPIAAEFARRNRATAAQASLQSARERRQNVRGAFSVNEKNSGSVRHVAIIDDVVTTGATVIALAGTLRSAGVKHIELWSIARARDP